jgi:hypothetical protein
VVAFVTGLTVIVAILDNLLGRGVLLIFGGSG